MSRIFIPARFPGGGAPSVLSMNYKTGETFVKGSVLIFDTGEVVIGLADPTPIVGVALEDVASKPGFEVGHDSQVIATTGRVQQVSVAIANDVTTFSGAGDRDPLASDVGVEYGIANVGGIWQIDTTDVVNTRVVVNDVDLLQNIYFFKFLDAHQALGG
jgi:hypothetical protein